MGLFSKQIQSDTAPLYTLGSSKTVLIVGLGNPGKEYDLTRHNAGFLCVDKFVEKNELGPWVSKKDLKCFEATGTLGSTRVIVIKPNTFMNNSGEAVQAVLHFYKVMTEQTVAVYDELAINFGQIRTRIGGDSAGHNGVKSIIASAGKGFGRVRIGINNEHAAKHDTSDFVLSKFSKDEQAELPAMTNEVNAILTEYIYGGELPHDTRNFII